MTLYQRPDEHVFAEGARPGEVQPFPDLSRGWGIAFEQTGGIPPMEWFNFIGKRTDEAIRYLMQRGLPEWSDTEEYPEGSYTQYAGKTYRAKVNNKSKVPQNNPAEWEEWGLTRAALDQHFHPKDGELAWPNITQTPTTLNGYGITDAATAQGVQHQFSELQLHWRKIYNTPSTVSGYGITDAAPLDSPAFVGSPTAPTPNDAIDNSTKIATTAFTHAAILASFNGPDQQTFDRRGYQKLPGGLIIQWGYGITDSQGDLKIIFPINFPRFCLSIQGIHLGESRVTVIKYEPPFKNSNKEAKWLAFRDESTGELYKQNAVAILRAFKSDGNRDSDSLIEWFAIGH